MKKDKVIRHGNTTHYKSQSCYVCKGEKPKYIEQVTHKKRHIYMKTKKGKERDGTLTLKKMKRLYDSIPREDYTIKQWQEPFLWFLWFFIGYTTEFESWRFYLVNLKGIKYLLKSKEL